MSGRKNEILDIAEDLLLTRSYSAFSYQDLADRLGIRKASIHHHFRTKQDLGVALMHRLQGRYSARLESIDLFYPGDPWERFEAYLAFSHDIVFAGDRISSIGVLQSESNVIPTAMRDGTNGLALQLRDWLAGVLSEGRSKKVMTYAGTPNGQAAVIVAALQGALQNGRSEGHAVYREVVDQIRSCLKDKRPKPAKS